MKPKYKIGDKFVRPDSSGFFEIITFERKKGHWSYTVKVIGNDGVWGYQSTLTEAELDALRRSE